MSQAPAPPASGPKPKKSVALSGVVAGNTALCTVGRTGNDLHYRGYDILDLAAHCEFEEVAHLLIHEHLPNAAELRRYKVRLRALRGLPAALRTALECLPAATHPMDVLRTGVSVLGAVLPERAEHTVEGARDIADRLLASCGSMLLYWYHFSHNGRRIDVETDDDSVGGHFLHLLHGTPPRAVLGAGHAYLAHPLRRARVQRLDLHRPRGRGHRRRLLLGHHRRDRRAARTQARRRQRSGLRHPVALPRRRRGRGRHPPAPGAEGGHHRFRPPRVHGRRSAQPGDQGNRPAPVRGGRLDAAVRRRRAPRVGHVAAEEDVPQPGLVQRGLLPHDGRAHGDVHAAVRGRAHHRLERARHRAAHRQQDHPSERQLHRPGGPRRSSRWPQRP